MAPFAVGLCVLLAMTLYGIAHAATFNATDDLTVSGTGGTSSDPDVHVRGYSSFATTPGNAGVATSGAGSLYIQGSAEIDGALYSSDGIWKTDGNLGIGTTNPGANLTVGNNLFMVDSYGNITKIRNVDYNWPTAHASGVLTNSGAGVLSWSPASSGSGGGWNRTGTSVYLNNTTAKVGIGLTNPVAKLDLRTAGTGVSGMGFRVSDTLGTDKVVILDNGSVGVGTTAPAERLHLQDGTLMVDKPETIRQIGSVSGSTIHAVYISGSYAYVTDESNGLRIYDITIPSSPTLRGTYDTTNAQDVWVSGRYAYVGDTGSGLRIIDVSSPVSPQQAANFDTGGNTDGVYVSGRYAYLAAGNSGVWIVDIAVPTSPLLLGTVGGMNNVYDVVAAGRYVYASNSNNGFNVLDVGNPASPVSVGTLSVTGANHLHAVGRYVYLGDGPAGLRVIDVSNPKQPSSKGVVDTGAVDAFAVYAAGRYAYVANFESGLVVVDVSDPAAPRVVDTYDTTYAQGVTVYGHYAYLADNNGGLRVFDIGGADVHALTAGTIETGALSVNDNADIGNNLYVRGGINVGPGGIHTDAGLSAGNTSLFRGNVGVGHSAPQYALDVIGDIRATGNIYGNAAGSSGGWTKSGTNLYLSNTTARVGVGNTAPAAKLEIRGAGTGAGTMGMSVRNSSGGVLLASLDNGNLGIGQSVPLAMLQVGTSPYPGLIVTAGGNAGIGTTSPFAGARLDVVGTVQIVDGNQAAGRVLTSNAAGVGNWADATGGGSGGGWTRSGTSVYLSNVTAKVGVGMTFPAAKLDIRTAGTGVSGFGFRVSDTLANDKVVILDNGNVGVGTTAPSEKFHLQDGTLRVDKPATLSLLSSLPISGPDYHFTVSGRYAYVNGNSMTIVDISVPASSTIVGTFTPSANILLNDVRVAGRYAYISENDTNGGSSGSGLEIVDISNPASPVSVGRCTGFPAEGGLAESAISGRYLYVAAYHNGMAVLDISYPFSPKIMSLLATQLSDTQSVALQGKYAYFTGYAGIEIYDISNPLSPIKCGYNTDVVANGQGRDLWVSGKYAYIATSSSGLAIVDVSNPYAPNLVSRYNTPATDTWGITSAGNYVYWADMASGLRIIDVSEPTSPRSVARYQTPLDCTDVLPVGRHLYSTGTYGAFYIFSIGGADVHALTAGTIETGGLTVDENADIGNNLYVRGGINAGPGGIHTDAGLSAGNTSLFWGNVGVGMTNPAYKLDVLGDIRATGNLYGTLATSTNGWRDGGVNVYLTTPTDKLGIGTTQPAAKLDLVSAGTTLGFSLRISDTLGRDKLVILDNGNVGIGTTNPGAMLQAGTAAASALFVTQGGNVGIGATAGSTKLYVAGAVKMIDGTEGLNKVLTSDANGLAQWTTPTGGPGVSGGWYDGGTLVYTSLPVYKLGIGLTNPTAKLDIRGAGTGASTWALRIADTLGTDKVVIQDNGNVGIGTTAPSEKFHIQDGALKVDKPNPVARGGIDYNSGTLQLYDAQGLAVSGKYAYVVNSGACTIIDISNPNSPTYVSTITDDGALALNYALNVYVAGRYAYIPSESESALQIIDVSNPSSPIPVGQVRSNTRLSNAFDVEVAGRYAYISTLYTYSGISIYDIADPTSPRFTAQWGFGAGGTPVTMLDPRKLRIRGRYLYAAHYYGLAIFDVSNPASPGFISTFEDADGANRCLESTWGLAVSGKYAYVTSTLESGIQIIDVSNPASMTYVGVFRDTAGVAMRSPQEVEVNGRYAYVTSYDDSGLAVLDISDPASPTHVASIVDSSSTYLKATRGLAVQGRYAYVTSATESGVQIIDLGGADVHALTAGTVETNSLSVNDSADIGNNLYVRGGINAGPGGIHADGEVASGGGAQFMGNVGVGATSPRARMEIIAANSSTGFYLNVAGGKLLFRRPSGGTNCSVCGPQNNSAWQCSNYACP